MRVLIVADAVVPVPPVGYGGTERIVFSLCTELVRLGFSVKLMGAEGSRVPCPIVYHGTAKDKSLFERAYRKLRFFQLLAATAKDVDLVHNFGRVDYLMPLLRLTNKPTLLTFQNPIVSREIDWVLGQRSTNVRFTSVSSFQRRHATSGSWYTVYNSTETEALPFRPVPESPPYLAFLGRLTFNKGVHIAIQVATKLGMRLRIAGNISNEPGGKEYFDRDVKPHLGSGVEWVGEITDSDKPDFLGGALALLFPIQWDEPFGIVMAEALSCGTPVVAFARGSATEIIDHEKTGYIVSSVSDMVTAVRRVSLIDRQRCRQTAEQRFGKTTMADSYVRLYESFPR